MSHKKIAISATLGSDFPHNAHHNPVTVDDGVQSVCNCQNSTLGKLFTDCLLNQLICSEINNTSNVKRLCNKQNSFCFWALCFSIFFGIALCQHVLVNCSSKVHVCLLDTSKCYITLQHSMLEPFAGSHFLSEKEEENEGCV